MNALTFLKKLIQRLKYIQNQNEKLKKENQQLREEIEEPKCLQR